MWNAPFTRTYLTTLNRTYDLNTHDTPRTQHTQYPHINLLQYWLVNYLRITINQRNKNKDDFTNNCLIQVQSGNDATTNIPQLPRLCVLCWFPRSNAQTTSQLTHFIGHVTQSVRTKTQQITPAVSRQRSLSQSGHYETPHFVGWIFVVSSLPSWICSSMPLGNLLFYNPILYYRPARFSDIFTPLNLSLWKHCCTGSSHI